MVVVSSLCYLLLQITMGYQSYRRECNCVLEYVDRPSNGGGVCQATIGLAQGMCQLRPVNQTNIPATTYSITFFRVIDDRLFDPLA